MSKLQKIYILIFMIVAMVTFAADLSAAEYNDGDTCGGVGEPQAGAYHRKNTVSGYSFLICDGTTWHVMIGDDFTLRNASFGQSALKSVTTGTDNVAIGKNASSTLTTANQTVAVGVNAGGNSNGIVAIGFDAGPAGDNTVSIGHSAGNLSNAIEGVFVGANAGLRAGDYTVALGHSAGENLEGVRNVLIGWHAGQAVFPGSTGQHNTIVGYNAGNAITTGSNNVFFGYQAGDATTTGSNNILIGYDIDTSAAGASNELNIGGTIFGDLLNGYVGVANSAPDVELDVTGNINFTGIITDVSDRRQKYKIRKVQNALEKIEKIRGVSFSMIDDKEELTDLGLIAQDVQHVFPELVKERSDGILSINYLGLTAPLVEAIKELDEQNKKLRIIYDDLQKRLMHIEKSYAAREVSEPINRWPKYNE